MSFSGWNSEEIFKDHFVDGIYVCSQCGYELFQSTTKFKHDSPWPAFTETMHKDSVSKREESTRYLRVSCGKCGNGLGHEYVGDGLDGKSRF